ncbi:MAG: RNA 2',3'-cyclic phosphodiesterase [Thermoplasmata archaeon]
MRLFYAVETPELPPWDEEAATSSNPEAPPHLTVRFLGEVDPARVPELERAGAEAVRALAPFELALDRVGAFPTESAPRIVWIGVGDGSTQLEELHRRLDAALEEAGVARDPRPFVAHVTWRRIRSARDREQARRLIEDARRPATPRSIVVGALLLRESRLGRNGALHRTVREFRLGAQPGSRPTRS